MNTERIVCRIRYYRRVLNLCAAMLETVDKGSKDYWYWLRRLDDTETELRTYTKGLEDCGVFWGVYDGKVELSYED